jgi:DNA-binding NtrC family response regulator
MTKHVYVTLRGEVVGSFALTRSLHVLGSGEQADLVLPRNAAPDVLCKIETSFDGLVTAVAAGGALLREAAGGAGAARRALPPGGCLDVGDHRLTLLVHPEVVPLLVRHTATGAPPTTRAEGIVSPRGEPMSLEWELDGRYWQVDYDGDPVLIGRGERPPDPACDFIGLPSELVSRDHCLLRWKDGGHWLQDLGDDGRGTTNGTGVNDRVFRGGGTKLEPGDLVRLPPVSGAPSFLLSYRRDALAAPRGEGPQSMLLGTSLDMRRVRAEVQKLAVQDADLFITGETGTGKELVARAVHEIRARGKPFFALNCGAIPENLIEGELFGHEKGAFTGAVARRQGPFELAQGGTVFLDEIGDLPIHLQVKLLRVLQERTVQRLGSSERIPCHFRATYATHRPLAKMKEEGTFREDLYYRIHVLVIPLTPLRERREDIRVIARIYARRRGRTLTEAALDVLEAEDWPGNVRQLQNALERSIVSAGGKLLLDASDLIILTDEERKQLAELEQEARGAGAAGGFVPQTLEDLDLAKKAIVERAVRDAHGKVAEAARKLGVPPRTLRNWCKRWKIAGD